MSRRSSSFLVGCINFVAGLLFLIAVKLDHWIQIPLAVVIVGCFVCALVLFARSTTLLVKDIRQITSHE